MSKENENNNNNNNDRELFYFLMILFGIIKKKINLAHNTTSLIYDYSWPYILYFFFCSI